MNRSKSYLTAFNTQVLNIVTEFSEMYPDDADFGYMLTAATMMKRMNPRLLYTTVIAPMVEYREQVFNEDEHFFHSTINAHIEQQTQTNEEQKQQERSERLQNETITEQELENEAKQAENNFNIVVRISVYWNEMSGNTKKEIWKRLKVLYRLSDKIL